MLRLLPFLLFILPLVSRAETEAKHAELTASEMASLSELADQPVASEELMVDDEVAKHEEEVAVKEPQLRAAPQRELTEVEIAKARLRKKPWKFSSDEAFYGNAEGRAKPSRRAPSTVVDLRKVIDLDSRKRKRSNAKTAQGVASSEFQIQMKPKKPARKAQRPKSSSQDQLN